MNQIPRFGLAEKAYKAFRPEYPPALWARIVELCPPRRRRAMDLGAGTGLSAIPLAKYFEEVIAVEPDENMAAHLRGAAPNVVVRISRAEDCEQPDASVDLVTCGTAFHWMDGPRVLDLASKWLKCGGLLAVYGGGLPRAGAAVDSIVQGEMKQKWDAFRHDRLRDERYSERIIRGCSEFECFTAERIPNSVTLTAEQFAGFWSSTSYVSAFLRTQSSPEACLRDLAEKIRQAAETETIHADFGVDLILARRRNGKPD